MPNQEDVEFLFTGPSAHPPSVLSPPRFPGITADSAKALIDCLKDNYKRWHIFFNYTRFHNHSMHHTCCIYALGVHGDVIRDAYEVYTRQLRPAFESPEPITDENFEKHLGDENFYDSYVNYFTDYAREHGVHNTLEKFVFSREYNTPGRAMLSRFVSGGMHPMIHIGYWAELGLPILVVEGLALGAVHDKDISKLFPEVFFNSIWAVPDPAVPKAPSYMSSVTGTFKNAASYIVPGLGSPAKPNEEVHALTILARVLADDSLTLPQDLDELNLVKNTVAEHHDKILDLALAWTIDPSRPGELDRKVEEIGWFAMVGYGVAGWTWCNKTRPNEGRPFNADFFMVHLATSVIFIPSILAKLESLHCKIAFLRSYLAALIAQFVSRGRPKLDVAGFYKSPMSEPYPMPYNELPTPSKDVLLGPDAIPARNPDPWLPLLQTTMVHPDTHLPKCIRSLAWLAARLGTTPAGYFGSPDVCPEGAVKTELPGAEYLDGSLFLRVAGMTCARMGRVGQGEDGKLHWDRDGFYEDPKVAAEAWKKMSPIPVD
ncbi:hypothetical protein D9756_010285 [Leucocoprinus leucothites]|uniref:Oxidoreductase AflY n=1 Tax=Leucocoprinus leucothites TaxID=201217 RepID=A0A8H5CTJ4_9AGAR|nr:hypothetical protein D9756_010285 [Leucoagaricus leucothites]